MVRKSLPEVNWVCLDCAKWINIDTHLDHVTAAINMDDRVVTIESEYDSDYKSVLLDLIETSERLKHRIN